VIDILVSQTGVAGARIFEHACKFGLEGIVSKRRDLPYQSGRSKRWLKIKIARRCCAWSGVDRRLTGPRHIQRAALGSMILPFST
jgi:hypothetical protein